MKTPESHDIARLRERKRRTLLLLSFGLIAGGLAMLFLLDRVPRPMRIVAGLTDIFAGLVLLVVARQKFSAPPR